MGLLNEETVETPAEETSKEPDQDNAEHLNNEVEDGSNAVDAPTRPEWLDEQFWDKKEGEGNFEQLSKSYSELRKAFNEKNNDKAGEKAEDYITDDTFDAEGNFNIEGYPVPQDDPGLVAAFEAAKEAGLGVKQAQTFIGKFLEQAKEFAPQEPELNIKEEMAKLGDNAVHVVNGIKTWVDGMQTSGQITAEVHAEIINLGATANGIKALDVLRTKTGELAMPTGHAITGTGTMSAEDWYSATFETHAESGESQTSYNTRMHEIGSKIFGNGSGGFNGAGLGS